MRIFLHSVPSPGHAGTAGQVAPGHEGFEERAVLLAGREDVVCVTRPVDLDYLRFLADLGLGPKPENVVSVEAVAPRDPPPLFGRSPGEAGPRAVNVTWALLANRKALAELAGRLPAGKRVLLDPYMLTPMELELAAQVQRLANRRVEVPGGGPALVDYLSQKHHARDEAVRLGIPVPEGVVVELQVGADGKPVTVAALRDSAGYFARKAGGAVVKGARGMSGSSVFEVEPSAGSIAEVLSRISERGDNSAYVIEQRVDGICSPNVIMRVAPRTGRLSCESLTDQRLAPGLAHQGNRYPSRAVGAGPMVRSARLLAAWMRDRGYAGLVGFDFVEYRDPADGRLKHVLVDVNPRTNAALYPRVAMNRLNRRQERRGLPPIRAFLTAKTSTRASSFGALLDRNRHLFFTPERGSGIVPYTIGCLERGAVHLAVFGPSPAEVRVILGAFQP